MRKKIVIVISIVLAIILAVCLWQYEKKEKIIEEIYRAMEQEKNPISNQIYDLKGQVNALEKKISEVQTGTATTQILITDLSSDSYHSIIDPMSNYSYPVVLGLSLSEMPGKEGCMSVEQAEVLAEKGWSFCYVYQEKELDLIEKQGADTLSVWMEQVRNYATEAGIDLEPAVYFPTGTYQDTFASALKAQGIQIVIHYGNLENGLLTATQKDSLWYVAGMWWRGNEILDNKISTIGENGGELVTLMGIDSNAKNTLQEWMVQFENVLNGSRIEVTNFSRMAAIQEENRIVSEEDEKQIEVLTTQVETLTTQIEELEQKRDEIVHRYMEEAGRYR